MLYVIMDISEPRSPEPTQPLDTNTSTPSGHVEIITHTSRTPGGGTARSTAGSTTFTTGEGPTNAGTINKTVDWRD